MKKTLSWLLTLALLAPLAVLPARAAEGDYAGKTVILYTGNVRGDVDVYPKIAKARADYEARGAEVLLVDTGNYLQGSAAANADRGLTVYNLMDAAGYDVAAMGLGEFGYGEAVTGFPYHGNLTHYYTQAQLQDGCEAQTYNRDREGKVTATLPAKAPAGFQSVCSGFVSRAPYSFQSVVSVTTQGGLKLKFFGVTDPQAAQLVQDGLLEARPAEIEGISDAVPVFLANVALERSGQSSGLSIEIPGDAGFRTGAYVIDNETRETVHEEVALGEADEAVAALAQAAKAAAPAALGRAEVILNGADSANRNEETNLGDFAADALKWYAETHMEGLDKTLPVVAIQNGGNCDQFLYTGDVTETDLLRALPFSPMGIGALVVTGRELLETLEAGSQQADCAGFAQVSGLRYRVNTAVPYDAGAAYGKFYEANSVGRVTILDVGGAQFDPEGKYLLVADNYVLNGNDTYYTLKAAKEAEGAVYVNGGGAVKTRDAAALYLQEALGGTLGQEYAQPQGRIQVVHHPFQDVETEDYYADAVDWAWRNGITQGGDDGAFHAQALCSRAQTLTMLWRAAGSPAPRGEALPFTDVPEKHYARDAICWAWEQGITNGVGGGQFAPGRSITREETATLFYRYLQTRGEGFTGSWMFLLKFEDIAEIHPWADEALHWFTMKGVLTGKPGNRLDPRGLITRGEVVTMVYRMEARG